MRGFSFQPTKVKLELCRVCIISPNTICRLIWPATLSWCTLYKVISFNLNLFLQPLLILLSLTGAEASSSLLLSSQQPLALLIFITWQFLHFTERLKYIHFNFHRKFIHTITLHSTFKDTFHTPSKGNHHGPGRICQWRWRS